MLRLCFRASRETKEGFLSLGSIGDYDHPYITLQKAFEAKQIEVFGKMALDGLIYKGLKPVYWSPSSETALAEAEVEYKDMKTPTIYVKFKVKDGKGKLMMIHILLSGQQHLGLFQLTSLFL